MRWECMSGDESDHLVEGRLLATKITRLPWRSRAVDGWMRVWCPLYLSTRFNGRWSCRKGNFPHPRYPRHPGMERIESGTTEPVPGLPENFYDREWMSREAVFDPDIRRTLRIQPPLNLKLPGGLLKWVNPQFLRMTAKLSELGQELHSCLIMFHRGRTGLWG